MLREILNDTGADKFEVWLSDSKDNNFRYQISSEYKANRKQPRPIHYEAIKEFLYDEWGANLALGQEADDSLGIRQTQRTYRAKNLVFKAEGKVDTNIYYDSIICTIDKDLLQIPGQHYNFVKKEFHTVELLDGIKMFWKQMLIGDVADNIKGVDKIGPVKAARFIDPLDNEIAMFNIVRNLYCDDMARLVKNGRLLWIRREEEQIWNPPSLLMEVPMSQGAEVK